MELSFSDLRAKEVVNTQDGRRLGRICDVALCYPENKWIGIVVLSGRGFGKRHEVFIPMRNIVKIGEDVILVDISCVKTPNHTKTRGRCETIPQDNGFVGCASHRNYEEFE